MLLIYIFSVGLIRHVATDEGAICLQSNRFQCREGPRCIPVSWFCDGKKNCKDGSDEPQYAIADDDNATLCRGTNRLQAAICVLPPYLEPERDRLCRKGLSCPKDQFECQDRTFCLGPEMFCDKTTSCKDGSDSSKFSPADGAGYRACFGPNSHFQGLGPCRLKEEYFCDGEPYCAEGMDECLCGGKKKDYLDNVCFRCMKHSGTNIPISKLCDGKFDCPDLTDECLCQSTERPEICNTLAWGGQEPYLQCRESNTSNRLDVSEAVICNNRSQCNNIINEKHCGYVGVNSKSRCKIRPRDTYWKGRCFYYANQNSYAVCLRNNLHCKVLLDNYQFEELRSNYSRGSISCTAEYVDRYDTCVVRYYCTNLPYQELAERKQCTNQEEQACNCSYFNCDDVSEGVRVIEEKSICDGFKDCSSGSDECQPGCIDSAFSDEKSLITDKGVLVLVWIFSVFAIIGCTSVVVLTSRDLATPAGRASKSAHLSINKLLIMSLSVSDLLVGIYTISICIKAVEVEGRYCYVDIEWRTSTVCSVLGALLIIGSEQSVLTMVLITIYRFNAVRRPLARPKFRRAVMAVAVSWVISIMFGLMPMVPSYEDYFVKYVSFNDTFILKTKVNQTDKERLINWLSLMNNGTAAEDVYSNTEWGKLKGLLSVMKPDIKAIYEFGYYSSHTVCLPTLFPDRRDKSWMYSFFVLLTNFLAFFFMLVCYIEIYRKANDKTILKIGRVQDKRGKQNSTMQRKFTRILVSDFLCWTPICIMGFLQLSGIDIPRDAYLPAGLLILPINSALNPFLYSGLPDLISAQRSKFVSRITDSFNSSRKTETSVRTATTQIVSVDMSVSKVKRGNTEGMK